MRQRLADGRCPVCGDDLRGRPAIGVCPRCTASYDSSEVSLEGIVDESGAIVAITLMWTAVIVAAVVASLGWVTGVLGVLMAAHVHCRLRSGLGRRRLVASSRGVALLQGTRTARYARWHLFDEARLIERRSAVPDHWKLILVNAYKPSISAYLHSRGTDEPIFTPCLEFEFTASPQTAEAFRRRLQDDIEVAGRSFRELSVVASATRTDSSLE